MKLLSGMKLIAALAVVAMSTAIWGQMPEDTPGPMGQHRPPIERFFGPPPPTFRWWNQPKMIEKLKLSDDQRKAFDQILEGHREKLIDLKANLERAELPMRALLDADQPDEATILAQIDKTVAARAALEKANASFLLAIRSKLTLQQWKQMKLMYEAHIPLGDVSGDSRRSGGGAHKNSGKQPGPQGMLGEGPYDDVPAPMVQH